MVEQYQKYDCQNCHKRFKVKRGRKILSLWDLREWLKKARCPFCGKKLRDEEIISQEKDIQDIDKFLRDMNMPGVEDENALNKGI